MTRALIEPGFFKEALRNLATGGASMVGLPEQAKRPELVYRYGVRVAEENAQGQAYSGVGLRLP